MSDIRNLIQYFDELGIESLPSSGDRRLRINCPFCTSRGKSIDTKMHMYISVFIPFAICYKCGWKGNYKELGSYFHVQPPVTAKQPLIPPTKSRKYDPTPVTLPPHLNLSYKSGATKMVWDYLRQRGLSDVDILDYGFCLGTSGRHKGRILMPVRFRERIVALVSRQLMFDGPKYYTDGERGVFNLDCGYHSVVLCEGIFDAVRVGRYAVATLGTSISDHQMKLLSNFFYEITILLDSEVKSTYLIELGEMLSRRGLDVSIAKLKEEDPSSCSEEVLTDAVTNAVSLHDTVKINELLIGGAK